MASRAYRMLHHCNRSSSMAYLMVISEQWNDTSQSDDAVLAELILHQPWETVRRYFLFLTHTVPIFYHILSIAVVNFTYLSHTASISFPMSNLLYHSPSKDGESPTFAFPKALSTATANMFHLMNMQLCRLQLPKFSDRCERMTIGQCMQYSILSRAVPSGLAWSAELCGQHFRFPCPQSKKAALLSPTH